MSPARGLIAALAAHLATAPAPPADEIRYVASRDVLLTFAAGNATAVADTELWVSNDDGGSWKLAPPDRPDYDTLRYKAASDGRFGFCIVLKNKAGASGEPPHAGSLPQVRVVVDTVAPTFQVRETAGLRVDADGEAILPATLVDENLGASAVRVFYRRSREQAWEDGGNASVGNGELRWPVPAGVGEQLDLRIVATDLAGNRAAEERSGLKVEKTGGKEAASAAGGPTTAPASAELEVKPVEPVKPAAPVVVKPVTAGERTGNSSSFGDEHALEAERLHQAGLRFLDERRYALATARLEEATELLPKDAVLLTDLGRALYGAERYDDAETRFAAAVQAAPEDKDAIEGLALVAATQKRYPQAREHLLHLLKLTPDSAATWLRYGDVEHRLGNVDKATAAWKRVLELEPKDRALRENAAKRLKYFDPARRDSKP